MDEGQYVHKGQLMFKIMPVIYEAEVEKAKAEMNFAEIEYNNMGAWSFVEKYINWTLESIGAKSQKVHYVGRKPSASTATGYLKKHVQQQDEIISKVLL